ncbi:MAG TPA: hypothetical protein ENI06_02860 [Spirochaetales bacterium]|nr:hypothetical protein [Spirochaetales bacterium]
MIVSWSSYLSQRLFCCRLTNRVGRQDYEIMLLSVRQIKAQGTDRKDIAPKADQPADGPVWVGSDQGMLDNFQCHAAGRDVAVG